MSLRLLKLSAILLIFAGTGALPCRADIFDQAVDMYDIDEAACASWHKEPDAEQMTKTTANINDVLAAFGFGEGRWTAGSTSRGWEAETFHYRIGFNEPVEFGSAMIGTGRLKFLKPEAPYPGDPFTPEHWTEPEVMPNQSGARLITLEEPIKTRALLITDVRRSGWSTLTLLRLFCARLYNITPNALANAEAEYTVHPFAGPPHTYAAADIVKGAGRWVNSGADQQGRNLRPPVSDIDPSWFVLSWKEENTISGLWMIDNFSRIELYRFIGPETLNPAVGTDREWKKISEWEQRTGAGRWISFSPVKTRGLKIMILKTSNRDPQVASISGLHVFTDLGDAPVPAFRPQAPDQPPYRIPYTLPFDGKLTMVIDTLDGRRLRNLVGLVSRTAGNNAEYWDLKDEEGRFVAPGKYRWKAIVHPPLQLKYEMTPYPNVMMHAPENTPWLNGHAGPGGWMADHTPPKTVAVSGNRVFFGAPTAESGVSTIECDLEGRKLWGHHSYAAWTGPEQMAADNENFYIASNARGIMAYETIDPSTEIIWQVNIATKEVSELIRLQPTSKRKRGLQSLAAGGGKVYLSINADARWLVNAARTGDVDQDNCLPKYVHRRKERYAHEVVPDPRNDFLRLFRLHLDPAGNVVKGALVYLETTKGPARRQHICLAFNREVPLGSVVYPVPQDETIKVRLSVLKPDAPYPPDVEDDSQWLPFEEHGTHWWDVVPAPPNTRTRALRITMIKGADDLFAQVEDERLTGGGLDSLIAPDNGAAEEQEEQESWQGRLEGMRLLRRRYVNLSPQAQIRVNSGTVHRDGSWDAERPKDRPVTPDDPGIFVQQWETPQEIRGLAIKEVDGKTTEIDIYTGPDDAEIDINGTEHWKHVATYHQARRYFYPSQNANPLARYMDGMVDLGPGVKTRAVRLRITEQWLVRRGRPYGVRQDRGGITLDPTRCRVYGVAALKYLGGEDPVDPLLLERIEVVDVKKQQLENEIFLPKPGAIALDRDGALWAVSGKDVVKVDLSGAPPDKLHHKVVVHDLRKPQALAFDSKNNLYVFDNDPERKVIRVYDRNGRYLRSIGTPGGYVRGPWTGRRFENVCEMAIDKLDHLWVVEYNYWPKRISRWTTDGALLGEFLGNTQYGGGGVLDPYDKTRLFYGPLEFELNWKTRATRLKNLTWTGNSRAGELPVIIDGRRYMVTRVDLPGNYQACGVVYLYEKDHLRRVAAMGLANSFDPLRTPEVCTLMGDKGLTDYKFVWSDLNGDENVQADEVKLTLAPKGYGGLGMFNSDLGIQAGRFRYEVKEFLPNGVPVYEERRIAELPGGAVMTRMDDGNYFKMAGMSGDVWQEGLSADGTSLWRYRTEGIGVHALYRAKPLHSSQVVAEFGWIGHETAHAGDLGEFFVFNSNVGTWNIWTSDGLLAGRIFRDIRDPLRQAWSMRDNSRGLRLEDVTPGQEHFQGYFCRTKEDNKYYVVAGHNHASVVEVVGMDKFKRLSGEFTVAPEDVRTAVAWELEQQNKEVYERAKVIDCFRRKRPVKIDGSVDDWETVNAVMEEGAKFSIAYDDRYLYVCYQTRNMGPMKNTGEQWDRLFKTGASVDLQMGVDPEADPARRAPVEGDFRLLMTRMQGKLVAVLYEPVVPGTRDEDQWKVVSPVFEVRFDRVRKLPDVHMACHSSEDAYVFEAAIPLKTIGLEIKPDLRLSLDWGVLVSGKDGNEVLQRIYWSNKATSIISDAPSEAVLHPDLWGTIRFHEKDSAAPDILDPLGASDTGDEGVADFIDELEEDLK